MTDMPVSKALYERAVKVMPGGNTRTTVFMKPHPFYAAQGSGCRLTDVEGQAGSVVVGERRRVDELTGLLGRLGIQGGLVVRRERLVEVVHADDDTCGRAAQGGSERRAHGRAPGRRVRAASRV